MKKLIFALVLALMPGMAFAQSSPGLYYGQVPTAAQWNSYFAAKQDVLGYTPVNRAGDTMTGKLTLIPSGTALAPLNVPEGATPASPQDGDIWTEPSGMFARIEGATITIGGQNTNPKLSSQTSNYTVTGTDTSTGAVTILADATGGSFTITVPATLGAPTSSPNIQVRKTDASANVITVSDGSNTLAVLQRNQAVQIVANGTAVFTAVPFNSPIISNVWHIGGNTTVWSGDIGQQFNAAYALASPGDQIVVDPKTGGGAYDYTHTLNENTKGKCVKLIGAASGLVNGATPADGQPLNYTPSSGDAMFIDCADDTTTGHDLPSNYGVESINFVNNQCVFTNGCGGSANGIHVGLTNAGDGEAVYTRMTIKGFGGYAYLNIGVNKNNAGQVFYSCDFSVNHIGFSLGNPYIRMFSQKFGANGFVYLADAGTDQPEIHLISPNFVANAGTIEMDFTTAGATALLYITDPHLENQPASTAQFIAGNVNFYITGGIAEDDNGTGTATYMFNPQGQFCEINGMEFATNRNYTQIVLLNTATRCKVSIRNRSSGHTAPVFGGSNASLGTDMSVNVGSAAAFPWSLESTLTIGVSTVTGLPTCNAGIAGAHATVKDQSGTPTYHGALTGSGSTYWGAFCTGSAWVAD